MLSLIRFLLHFNGMLCKFARPSALNANNQENFSFGAMRGCFYCRKQKYSPRVAPLYTLGGCSAQHIPRGRPFARAKVGQFGQKAARAWPNYLSARKSHQLRRLGILNLNSEAGPQRGERLMRRSVHCKYNLIPLDKNKGRIPDAATTACAARAARRNLLARL
jgi:hypothetical protein